MVNGKSGNADRFGRPMCEVCGRYGVTDTCAHRRIITSTPEERWLAKVQVAESGCWEWTAFVHRTGYGRFRIGARPSGQTVFAHRWGYEHFLGPIPAGLMLDHLCRNRACVNPTHLEAVTFAENVRRGWTARRAAA